MSNFKFNPTQVTPQTSVTVALEPKQSPVAQPVARPRPANQTDSERIASAKARSKASVKGNNLPGAEYGFDYPPEYFKDGCGVETSTYDFEHLFFILGFLQDPKFEYQSLNHRDGSYNSLTGVFTQGEFQISIRELKDAVAERIAELEISEVLLLEYLAEPHGHVEYQQFHNLSFYQQMQKFRREDL
jgi:hypothetical protein